MYIALESVLIYTFVCIYVCIIHICIYIRSGLYMYSSQVTYEEEDACHIFDLDYICIVRK